MSETFLSDQLLGATAHWTAAARALESGRADRLFDDPWAAALAGPAGAAWMEGRTPDSVAPMIIRTRYFDDFLQRVTQQDGIRQVVLLAAGLDTRAFRLVWPESTHWFELDQPAVLQYKEEALAGAQPACIRRALPADLTQPWQEILLQAGFEPQQPSAWLLEGFLFYLPDERIRAVLDGVNGLAAARSWLGCDVINSLVLTSPWTRKWVEMQASLGAPWIGVMDDPPGFFAARGWKAALSQAGTSEANYGRWTLPVLPVAAPGMPHNWYVTAQKE